jgi:uncharacterized protein
MKERSYLFLHGFASSPGAKKASFFRQQLANQGIELQIPDLNQGEEGFFSLTLSRQIHQVEELLSQDPQRPVVLIGSSFGALTATWVAHRNAQRLEQMVLMAPAFGFLERLCHSLGVVDLQRWKEGGSRLVPHFAYEKMVPLSYGVIEDIEHWREEELTVPCPTLLFHGEKDPTVPVEGSVAFARRHSQIRLRLLDSNHSLLDSLPTLWEETARFLEMEPR